MKVFVINAFAEKKFSGNPAAVIPLQQWLSDEMMQAIAAQHNLSETAYIIPTGDDYSIRWFTPTVEVDLCGHATLASAHVLFSHLGYDKSMINFHSKSGILRVTRNIPEKITLDFPANTPQETGFVQAIKDGLNYEPLAFYKSSFDYMVVVKDQQELENISPDFKVLAATSSRGVIATAKGDTADFVSRCFYPQSGIDEDPVTGSAHTVLVPYWAKKLDKNILSALQLSKRGGRLDCELAGERVLISGRAITYLEGEIFL